MVLIWAAIILGFASSFHCIGMCGPIAIALPIGKVSMFKRTLFILLYNAGRILTYCLLGAVFGMLGSGIILGSFQQSFSVSVGIVLLLTVLLPKNKIFNSLNSGLYFLFGNLKNKLAKLFKNGNSKSVFLIGLLNGLLPCGMVYMAIAGALATANVYKGIVFMTFFGVGTLAVMLALPLFTSLMALSFRNKIRITSPIITILIAIIFIIRGLNLGIPYLSPSLNTQNQIVCETHNNNHKLILCGKPKTVTSNIVTTKTK